MPNHTLHGAQHCPLYPHNLSVDFFHLCMIVNVSYQNLVGCESQVLGEKVNFFNSLGIIEISGIYKLSTYIDIALLKIFTE